MTIKIIEEQYYKGVTFSQTAAPTSGMVKGDTWLNSNGVLKIYNSVTWECIENLPASANFTVDDETSAVNQTLQFTDQSQGDIVDWLWDFGDSNTTTVQNPTHQYASAGQYTVSLTITDSGSNQDTKTVTNFITVANDPGASFVADSTVNHINTDITFTDNSTTNGTISAWSWDFGDGITSTAQNPVHQYTTSGQYTVALTVTDEFGSDTMTRTNYIAIDVPPTAAFVSDIQSAGTNENITFTDQSISFGTISAWAWDFGDGNTSTLQNPVHQYTSPGNYTVALTVTDEYGNDTETKADYITITVSGTGYDYGYCMGGYDGSNSLSTIDRITFPFDSGTPIFVGALNSIRHSTAGCNSSNYGYSMGGYGSNYVSTIDRITFPFDSGTATHVGNLSNVMGIAAGSNSSNYGYCLGGVDNGSRTIIDRITFPFDSGTASHVGNLSHGRYGITGCNSSNYGYNMGGSSYSTIDRITFPFDSGIASHIGNLSGGRRGANGCNSSNYGYNMGGFIGESCQSSFSTIDRITFPFDSGIASHVGNLSSGRSSRTGCNSSNYGYSMGGYDGSNNLSTIDRITFPFDSGTAIPVGNLSSGRSVDVGCDGTDFVTLFA